MHLFHQTESYGKLLKTNIRRAQQFGSKPPPLVDFGHGGRLAGLVERALRPFAGASAA
jgi:hypothetical protein